MSQSCADTSINGVNKIVSQGNNTFMGSNITSAINGTFSISMNFITKTC